VQAEPCCGAAYGFALNVALSYWTSFNTAC